MAWLELHQTVKKHRKTLRLSTLLSISRREAVGLLCDLWLWAIDNADKHGLLDGMSAEDIGMALDMNKRQSDRTVQALVDSGYMDVSDGQYVLHDWYEYCGKLNEKRESDRKRKADNRRKSAGNPQEVQRTEHGSPLVTVPNLTVPNPISSLRSDIGMSDKQPQTRTKFTPPTLEEVRKYCMERGNSVDPERFIDFYASKGWMIGKNTMKDWKAAVRTWEKDRSGDSPKPVEYIDTKGAWTV